MALPSGCQRVAEPLYPLGDRDDIFGVGAGEKDMEDVLPFRCDEIGGPSSWQSRQRKARLELSAPPSTATRITLTMVFLRLARRSSQFWIIRK